MKTKNIRSVNGVIFIFSVLVFGVMSLQAVRMQGEDIERILDGTLFRRMENHYQESFPIKSWVTGFWAALSYILFSEGRDGVVVGRNQWLFSAEEFRLNPDCQEQWESNLELIGQYQKQLQQNNIALLVVLLPEKADLYRRQLKQETIHTSLHLYQRSYRALRQQGVNVVNAREAMLQAMAQGDQVYFRTDTHWTLKGAEVTARKISESGFLVPGSDIFFVKRKGAEALEGDLKNFIPTGDAFSFFAPRPDTLQKIDIYRDGAGMDLLSDPVLDTVLVGTSYSADRRWMFLDWLQYYLHKEVLDYSRKGKGPFAPMQSVIDAETKGDSEVSHVIWEIPVRYLLTPVNEK